MSQHRKHRGYESQRIVADYLRAHGWPYAEPTGAGRQGSDVTGLGPLFDVEVKARRDLDLTGTLAQLQRRADCDNGAHIDLIPFAVIRPDGYGPARIGDWPVVIRLADFLPLMHTWEDS